MYSANSMCNGVPCLLGVYQCEIFDRHKMPDGDSFLTALITIFNEMKPFCKLLTKLMLRTLYFRTSQRQKQQTNYI